MEHIAIDQTSDRQQRLRACQLQILDEALRVFNELELTYFAGFGTLLGACRHHGYIPWDDDIDLMMPAHDFMQFISKAPQILGDTFYLQSHVTNVHNIISWARIGLRNTTSISEYYRGNKGEWGICLDIFPLIPTGDCASSINTQKQKKVAQYIRLCRKYDYVLDAKHGNLVRKVYSYWQARENDQKNVEACYRLMDELFVPINGECTHYLCVDAPALLYPCNVIDGPTKQSPSSFCEFEGRLLRAPYDMNAVLTLQYGDWRTLPPEDKRVNHTDHEDIILSFDTPWTHYLR